VGNWSPEAERGNGENGLQSVLLWEMNRHVAMSLGGRLWPCSPDSRHISLDV
jgi:hypothetical protein